MIFDTHCHLNNEELLNRIDEVIESAKKVGITKFLVVGWNKESSITAVKLAEQYDCIYAAVGFHPTDVFDVTEEDFDETMSYLSHPKVVALGEIGLDYHWIKEEEKREIQKRFFIKQIGIANEFGKPISIHNRNAFEDTLTILKEHKPKFGGVMHCYSGSVEALQEVLKLGLYIGLDGPLTFTNAKTPKEVCEEVPLDKLLVETDCPYLSPHPLRGTVNEPKNIALILDEIARIKQISKKHILDVVYKNSCKLFGVEE